MQYTYELRDRTVNSRFTSVLREMEEALSSHVFLDKGKGPIESGYSIVFRMQESLVNELANQPDHAIEAFRKQIFNTKKIPVDTVIQVFSKGRLDLPVLTLGRSHGRFISTPSARSKPIHRGSLTCS